MDRWTIGGVAMGADMWKRRGRLEIQWADKLPVPFILGAGRHRVGPDPAGNP